MQTYTLKVIDIKKETGDTVTLSFKQPGLKKIKYKAGQYLTLIFRINGRRYLRPYSLSSAPGIDANLEITVKRVTGGIISNHINDMVKVDDFIEILYPMGDFVLPEIDYKTIFLWGAGSGITPLMSLTKYLLKTNPKVFANLIYSNKNKETTIFHEKISDFSKEHKDNFKAWHFHTQIKVEENLPDVIQGRINPKKVLSILNNANTTGSLHFICGPTGLKESVKEVLTAYKIPKINIFSEDFELIKDPKDFEDIETQNIKLNFEGNDTILEVVKGKSILEVALDAGIELPYSCQIGSCNTCTGTLKQGKLKMIGLKEERKDLKKNEFLLCCSHPLTNDVYVKI